MLLFIAVQINAQEYVIDFKHWDVKSGLIHRQVNCICQDRLGFTWIGTPLGLGRFDGLSFTWFTHEKDGIPFNCISRIAGDADGNLLIMGSPGEERQLFLFDPVSHKTLLSCSPNGIPKGTYFLNLYELQDGRALLVASNHSTNGLNDNLPVAPDDHKNYLWDARNGFSVSMLPADYYFMSVIPQKNAYLVRNTNEEFCLVSMEGKLMKKVKAPFPSGANCGMAALVNKYVPDERNGHVYRISPDLDITDVTAELPVPDNSENNNIFDAGIDGITWRGKLFHPAKGLLRDFVKEGMEAIRWNILGVHADRKNNDRIWICNDFGLYMLSISRKKFRQYFGKGNAHEAGHNSYRSILVRDSSVYCSNEGLGVYRQDLRSGYSGRVVDMPAGTFGCYALRVDSDGELTGSLGANLFFHRQGKPAKLFEASPDKNNRIWSVHEYSRGKFLLGMSMGIIRFNKEQGKFSAFEGYNGFKELERAVVLDISKDRKGETWICCDRGLFLLDTAKGIKERYSRNDSGTHYLPAMEFQHFYQDEQGIFWLATKAGLIRWDRQKSRHKLYTHADGLSNNNIYAVYGDRHNRLWLSSDYGIMRVDKATGAVKTYLTGDGITDNEFNRTSHYMDSNGVLYFGTLNGITAFNPDDFADSKENTHSANLAVASFLQFNGKENKLEDKVTGLMQTNEIRMLPDDRFFTLEFSLLNYLDPEQTTYYWKIDGIDTGWNVQKDRTLRLSRLPYGQKTLRVKAQAADGTWSANELSFKLDVVAPFYLKTWFIVAAIFCVCALAFGAYRWRVRFFRRETKRLDLIVQQKTSDLQNSLAQKDVLMKEIHHRVKNNLQVIGTLLDLQLDNIDDERARKAVTEGMGRIKSIGLIHQQLYKENEISTLEFSQFVKDLFRQVSSIFRKPGQNISYDGSISQTFLDIDTAVPLGLILNELITNSYKYAFAGNADGRINIGLTDKGGIFELNYSDSGPGLPADYDRSKSNSLGMMVIDSLAKQLGGNCTYSAHKKEFIITFKGQEERKKMA